MKNPGATILVTITLVFLAFTLGLFLGINFAGSPIQVSVPASMQTMPTQFSVPTLEEASQDVSFPVNINTASKEALMALPGIGEGLAQRILDYREAVVLFSAPEELINVEGIGKDRLEQILPMITIGG